MSRAADIALNLEHVRATLPDGVRLVAVSKFHPAEDILAAYDAGQRCFGESRVAELVDKAERLPKDISWHFIGHLQTNKARHLIGLTDLIESIDSQHLLDLIDRLSAERGVITRVLMQVHVAAEETKYGWTPGGLVEFFAERRYRNLKATRICGLMAMATNTDDIERLTADFATVAELYRHIRETAPDLEHFDTLSMGMSDDYTLAIRYGANNVRVGSLIFGERTPH